MALEGPPLGSLYITTGVRDLGTVATLTRIRTSFAETDAVANRFLSTIGRIQTGLAGLGRANVGLTDLTRSINTIDVTRLERTAAAMERVSFANTGIRPLGVTQGGAPGTPGRPPTGGGLLSAIPIGFRGLVVFGAIGAGGAAFRQTADAEQEAIRASFAASPGNVTAAQAARLSPALRAEGRALAREFELGSIATGVGLIREITQIGPATRDAQAREELARAAAAFNVIEPNADPSEVAAAIFRLIQSTGGPEARSAEGLARLLASESARTGSLIVRGGELSAAGVGTVFEFVRALQTAGVISGATPEEVVGLATALSTIDPKRPTTFATAIQRITSKEFLDTRQAGDFARFLGISQEEFQRRAEREPIPLFLDLVRGIEAAGTTGGPLPAAIATELGLGNVRDVRTIGTLQASLGIFEEFVGESKSVEDEALFARAHVLLQTLRGDVRDFGTEAATTSETLIRRLAPAIQVTSSAGAGLLATLNDNPLLLDALLLGGVFLAGRGLGRFAAGRQAALGGRGGFLGGAADLASIALLAPFTGARRLIPSAVRRRFGAARFSGSFARNALGQGRLASLRAFFLGNTSGSFGIGSQTTLGLFGTAGGSLGARIALGATGLGAIISGIGLLEPVFSRLEEFFQTASTRGGVLGLVFEVAHRFFQLLAFSGEKINAGLGALGDFFKPVFDLVDKGAEFVRTEVLGGETRRDANPDATGGSGNAASSGGVTNDFTGANINIGSDAGLRSFFDDALRGSAGVA